MAPPDEVFAALADGTRRAVVQLLRGGPRRAGEIGAALDVSAPALSRHLRVLRGSGLVEAAVAQGDARARVYRLRREPFATLSSWAADVEAMWAEQLASFAALAQQRAARRRRP